MPEQTASQTRDYLVDNIKALLITTVVVGHFIESYTDQSVLLKALFTCIYSFHMPAFVFISGYLSKSVKGQAPHKMIANILIPYVLFSALWFIRDDVHLGGFYLDVFSPPFHLWYLLSLFTWRLLMPFVRQFKYYFILSVVLALVVGFSPFVNNSFAMSRTLALFPFFILGADCSSETLHAIHRKKYLAIFGVLLLGMIAFVVYRYDFKNWNAMFYSLPYHQQKYSNLNGLILRGIFMIAAGVISLSVIVISSIKRLFYTVLGARTITIYIFHGFLVPSFTGRFKTWDQSVVNNVIIIAFPFLLLYVLSLPVVEKAYHKIMSYITSALLIKA